MGAVVARKHRARDSGGGVRFPTRIALRVAALWVVLAATVPAGAFAAQWSCHGAKPGHPTQEERAAFVREIGPLAVKAEKSHGVPASALAAIAIAESTYGWTRVALDAHNLFAWRYAPSARKDGRKAYAPTCQRRRYVAFAGRADAFDYVAAKLATLDAYRAYTDEYKAARRRGVPADAAADAWLSGIATRYSRKPVEFTRKITRIINNAIEPADAVSSEHTLRRLSDGSGNRK